MKSRKILAVMLTFLMLLMPALSVSGISEDACPQHNWILVDPMVDPTCTEEGRGWYECTNCMAGEERSIPATGHQWGSWKEGKTPTCTELGYMIRYCVNCNMTELEELSMTDHTWTGWTTVTPATCTSTGSEVRSCTNCEAEQYREIPVKDHDWGRWKTVTPATCTTDGIEEKTCNTCGVTQNGPITAPGHTWEDAVVTKQPTCTEKGEQDRKCAVCGLEETQTLDCIPHSFGEWEVVREATPFEPGERRKTCSVCGFFIAEEFDPDGTLYRGNDSNDKDAVQQLQQALNDAGYNCGAADGIFGEKTENAVKDFQKDHGMNPSGIAYPGVLMVLGEEVDSYEPSVGAYETEPVLWLTMKQASPQKEKYMSFETVTYDWTVTNIGGENVDFTKIIFADGGVYFRILPTSTDYLYEGPTQTLEKHGGSISGSSELKMPQKYIDTDQMFVMLEALGTTSGSDEKVYESNQVYFEYTMDPESVQQPEEVQTAGSEGTEEYPFDYSNYYTDSGITLEKGCISSPDNGMYFVAGEEIVYSFTLRNTGETTYTDVQVEDSIGATIIPVVSYELVLPGFEQTFTTAYTVTDYDAALGGLQDHGVVYGTEGNEDYQKYLAGSNIVYVPVGSEGAAEEWENVAVAKEEISTPENADFYVEGETIQYRIYIYNYGQECIENVWCYDSLYSYDEACGYLPEIEGAESANYEFSYLVTADDVENGYVENYAVVRNGATDQLYYSNHIISRCGKEGEDPDPENQQGPLSVVKQEVTTPSNGSYYVEGETIGYEIYVTNTSETTVSDVYVYDEAQTVRGYSYGNIYLGYIEDAEPGSTYVFAYEWDVDSYDIAEDCHVNTAYAVYPMDTADINMYVYSDVVWSPCGDPETKDTEKPTDTETEPGAPVEGNLTPENPETSTDPEAEPGAPMEGDPTPENPAKTETKENEKPVGKIEKAVSVKENAEAEETDCCTRTLKAKGDKETLYDVHYCAAHQAILDRAEELSAEGTGKEEKAEAWKKIGILWSNEVSAQYAEYINASRGDAADIVIQERDLYFRQMKAYKASLELAYPEDPDTVEEILAAAYRNKCIDLCYEQSTAPEERTDSIIRGSYERLEKDPEQTEDCEDTILTQEEKDAHHQILFCEDHVKTKNAADVLLSAATNAEEYLNGFKVAQMLWQAKLDSLYSEWYLDSGEEDREIIAADRIAYGEWLEQREQVLEILYPENPEVVAEVLTNEISSRVVDTCR